MPVSQLQVPLQAYYYGTSSYKSWIPNNYDSCTTVAAGSVALSRYLDGQSNATTSWSTSVASVTALTNGRGTVNLATPSWSGTSKAGSVSLALNLGTGTADASCLANHPTTTGANLAYLRGQNGNAQSLVCAGSLTYSADPSANATFGIYTPESQKTMYLREMY